MTRRDRVTFAAAASDEFFLAQGHWHSFWLEQGNEIPSFAEFLGLTMLTYFRGKEIYDLNPSADDDAASHKIRMLCGPHWYALLKAYQLRRENDREKAN